MHVLVDIRQFLETLHFKTGKLLVVSGRMLATAVAVGSFFCLLMFGGLLMTRHPERVLQMEAFHFNYDELNRVQNTEHEPEALVDPVWDGALAGFGLGVEAGRMVPVVGVVAGPALGAVMGYELDKQI